jgi:magnesium-transporting ATPase (P-type)
VDIAQRLTAAIHRFLAVGAFTSLVGIAVYILLPSTPMQAWFLSEEEKVLLLLHVRENQTGISETETHFQPKQIVEALTNLQVWLPWIIVVLHLSGAATISTFSSMLIRGFGFDSKSAALLNMPSGAVNMIAVLFCGAGASLLGQRWAWISFASLVSITGACLLAFLPHSNRWGLLASIYLVNAISGATPLVMQWLMGNTAGHTKRAFASAAMSAAFALGSIIAPQTFRAADAPDYQPAKVASLVLWVVAVVLTILLMVYCRTANAMRDRRSMESVALRANQTDTDCAGLTDKQNPNFRYQY